MKSNDHYNDALAGAYRMLLQRDRSESEIRTKLFSRGFDEKIIGEVIEELKRLDYLNDEEFARNLVHHYQATRRFGFMRIKFELVKKGISNDAAAGVMNEYSGSLEKENLKHLIIRNLENGKSKEQIFRILQRKGYSNGSISDAGEGLWQKNV